MFGFCRNTAGFFRALHPSSFMKAENSRDGVSARISGHPFPEPFGAGAPNRVLPQNFKIAFLYYNSSLIPTRKLTFSFFFFVVFFFVPVGPTCGDKRGVPSSIPLIRRASGHACASRLMVSHRTQEGFWYQVPRRCRNRMRFGCQRVSSLINCRWRLEIPGCLTSLPQRWHEVRPDAETGWHPVRPLPALCRSKEKSMITSPLPTGYDETCRLLSK